MKSVTQWGRETTSAWHGEGPRTFMYLVVRSSPYTNLTTNPPPPPRGHGPAPSQTLTAVPATEARPSTPDCSPPLPQDLSRTGRRLTNLDLLETPRGCLDWSLARGCCQ